MDSGRLLVVMVTAAAATAILSLLASRARPGPRGWRQLRPSAMHWTGMGLGGALLGLFAYVRLFVGSTRADAATQMTILTGLILAFGLMTMATALSIHQIRRRSVSWRGDVIRFRGPGGPEERRTGDVRHIGRSMLGHIVLTFDDNVRLRIDAYATGAAELIERVAKTGAR
ncbi:MAG: hypothetical protein AAGE05_10025 [Pseudomonadota bacterium]